MKYFLLLLLLSAILIHTSYTANAQNQSNNTSQNLTGIDKNNNSSSQTNQSANQSATNNQNKTGETEQDKALKNITQATNQVTKQTTAALSNVGSQVGEAFQNLTGIDNGENVSKR